MKKVYVVMVGDLFHYGHVEYLKSARSLGDYLVVGVVPDNEAANYKRWPVMTADERKRVILGCRYVDEVIDQSGPTTTTFMRKNGFEVFAYATQDEEENQRNVKEFYSDLDSKYIVKLPYTDGISTTQILERIRNGSDYEGEKE